MEVQLIDDYPPEPLREFLPTLNVLPLSPHQYHMYISQFKQKDKNIEVLYVLSDNKIAYFPGDAFSGHIYITNRNRTKPFTITDCSISLSNQDTVYCIDGEQLTPITHQYSLTGSHIPLMELLHNSPPSPSADRCFDLTPSALYVLAFSGVVPEDTRPTSHDEHCCCSTTINLTITEKTRLIHQSTLNFQCSLFIHPKPTLTSPDWVHTLSQTVRSASEFKLMSGTIMMALTIPSQRLSALEEVPVSFEIKNNTKKTIRDVYIKLRYESQCFRGSSVVCPNSTVLPAHHTPSASHKVLFKHTLGLSIPGKAVVRGVINFCPSRLVNTRSCRQTQYPGSEDFKEHCMPDQMDMMKKIKQLYLLEQLTSCPGERRDCSEGSYTPKSHALFVRTHVLSLTCDVVGRSNPKLRIPLHLIGWPSSAIDSDVRPPLPLLGPFAHLSWPLYCLDSGHQGKPLKVIDPISEQEALMEATQYFLAVESAPSLVRTDLSVVV
eukprot:gnl/Dysnectes_brevis/6750_a10705_225.p1 GENE.gnl/Dysnectes_brevis/6750_a10705_225~~gnl/Dysnectes_brevis/6750_a10705_225.p1  ORF type:complete len:492 (-),score=35.17 gnl/Dysnectes_brevis/6750_a10705_225:287-1762(-)